MNILNNGNVGIGVTNPSQRLHVVGQMAVENGDGFTPRLNFISGPNNTNPWRIRANVNDSTNIGLLFEENTTTLKGKIIGTEYDDHHFDVEVRVIANVVLTYTRW
jgi:hypothetical protein